MHAIVRVRKEQKKGLSYSYNKVEYQIVTYQELQILPLNPAAMPMDTQSNQAGRKEYYQTNEYHIKFPLISGSQEHNSVNAVDIFAVLADMQVQLLYCIRDFV
ncbi:hypothetical protein FACS189476_03720 [Spirochaetia bacterium]|nr:hypothetical protein FACS189476_03720 [Spirochaetia bacterium]